MAATPISITKSQLFALLRAWFLTLLDPAIEVVQGQDNRVPMPKGQFVVITPGRSQQMASPVMDYEDETVDVSQSTGWTISVDCYGKDSGNFARVLSMALRTPMACEAMPGIAPLYADDAVQFPLVSGEAQYVERWRFDSVLHYNPTITLAQQSAIALAIDVVNVDATYHP